MLDKIKKISTTNSWRNFRDVRFLGFLAFAFIVLLTTWSGINIIQTNYKLQQEIAEIDQRNQLAELQNSNLKLQNEYYNTDTYIELTLRQQFSKGAPGEKLILVPKDVALAHVPKADVPTSPKNGVDQSDDRPQYQKNFQAWLDFFFHRQPE